MICVYGIWLHFFLFIFLNFIFIYFSSIPLADNIYSVMAESKLLVWLRCECDKWNQFMASHHLNSTSLVSKSHESIMTFHSVCENAIASFIIGDMNKTPARQISSFSVESYIYGYSMAVINKMEIIYKKEKKRKKSTFSFLNGSGFQENKSWKRIELLFFFFVGTLLDAFKGI